jgi:hypothetical protein
MSRHYNEKQNLNLLMTNKFFEYATKVKYL